MLAEYGQVQSITIPTHRDTKKPRGFAFVEMATQGEMESAITGIHGQLLQGRVLRASPPLSKEEEKQSSSSSSVLPQNRRPSNNSLSKIYIGNIAYDTTSEMLVQHFEQFGKVFEVYLPQMTRSTTTDEDDNDEDNNTNNSGCRGYAFLTVPNSELEHVIEMANGTELNGRQLSVALPRTDEEKKSLASSSSNTSSSSRTKIFVGNLSFYTNEETLEEVFSEFGTILDAYIPMDAATGNSRGFGFVTMNTEDALQAIAELDECELDGRIIRVNKAQPKDKISEVR
jgi:RNA recognition motif-containing protein